MSRIIVKIAKVTLLVCIWVVFSALRVMASNPCKVLVLALAAAGIYYHSLILSFLAAALKISFWLGIGIAAAVLIIAALAAINEAGNEDVHWM